MFKTSQQNRVYCSGLWRVEGNVKRSHEHYNMLLPLTLDLIRGSKLRFFSNDTETIERVAAICKTMAIDLEVVYQEIEDLPGWGISGRIVRSTERMRLDCFKRPPKHNRPDGTGGEKAFAHYWRDLKRGNADVYRQVLAVWMSKVALSASFASDADETCHVVWIDASIARVNGRRRNWNFNKVILPFEKISHYSNNMTFYGYRLPLSAGLLGGDPATWKRFRKAFTKTALQAAQMPYGHDEETILGACHWSQPDLFYQIDKPIPKFMGPFFRMANRKHWVR